MRRVQVGARARYEIEIGAGVLRNLGEGARGALPSQAHRLALISNCRVFELYGAQAVESLRAAGFDVTHWLMGEGERYKTLRSIERALAFLSASRLERSDGVVALGGGVVGDLAGFAAAIYLRGVAFVQVPTTLLAQIDSSVGGKTGVNMGAGKNLVGAFHQPRAVFVDTETLGTLPPRELTAGWCEAIKQGAVGDRKLFEQTRAFLAAGQQHLTAHAVKELSGQQQQAREAQLIELIAAQCAFKAQVVAGDEREDVNRADRGSRRILNFGHTVAHALEALTGYRRFRHGEAVGYGMLAAAEISFKLGLLAASELELLRATIGMAGRLPRAADLDAEVIRQTLSADKKAVGGRVRWVLLEKLGRARIVDEAEISTPIIRASIQAALDAA